MKGFRKTYLRGQLPGLGLGLGCCAVFAVTFRLYGLPLGAVGYPAALCAVGWLLFAFLRGAKAARKHAALSALTAALTEDMLPPADTPEDADYRRIIALLQEAREKQEADFEGKYADMVAYYTLWAHQIKTPIAAMRLTLQNEDSPLSRRLTAELGRIERYVEMVLAYLRLDSTSTDYVLREYELDPILRAAVKKFSGEFIERRLALDLRPTGARVLTDEKWLSFVLEQLLSNALKYTPAGIHGPQRAHGQACQRPGALSLPPGLPESGPRHLRAVPAGTGDRRASGPEPESLRRGVNLTKP